MTDILARLAVCEKASIDECYLDITAEAKRRSDAQEQVQAPINAQQVHMTGQVTELHCALKFWPVLLAFQFVNDHRVQQRTSLC